MSQKRVLIGYGIDLDAAANHLNTTTGPPPNLTNISRGIFGATRGVERLLELFARTNIRATWFIPGHTLESFPESCARIRNARPCGSDNKSHEIGLHNYTHEYPADLSREAFETVLKKSIDVLTEFNGGTRPSPLGFTAPAWRNSEHQIELLEKHGIEYDHSFMHDDFQMYFAPYSRIAEDGLLTTDYKSSDPEQWMAPMKTHSADKPKVSSVVEVPANWTLDDWPPFQWDGARPNAHGYVDPHSIERQWKEQFEWCYREYDQFVFTMTIHPQVSGRPHILLMHERLIEWFNSHQGIEWVTFGEMAREFREESFKEKRAEGRWLT